MNEPMTARDALDTALRAADFQDEPYDVDAILAALPPGWILVREAVSLGVAWAAVEAVLPEGWYGPDVVTGRGPCRAQVFTGWGYGAVVDGYGPTPTEALHNLHAALLAREEGSRGRG